MSSLNSCTLDCTGTGTCAGTESASAPAHAASAPAPAPVSAPPPSTPYLERMLLEAVANGSVTCGDDVYQLIR